MVLLKFNHKTSKNRIFSDTSHELAVYSATVRFYTNHLSRKEVTMTSNQIAYFKAKIEEAHYGRSDEEQRRSNLANEALKSYQISVDESHYLRSDAENERSNKARESENYRSNRAKEDIEWSQIPSKNAERWSNVAKNYADVDVKRSQTALNEASTSLTNQQSATEWLKQFNVRQDTKLKEAQTENTETNTYWADMYAMSSVLSGFGSFFRGAGSAINSANTLGGTNNGKTEQLQQTGKQTQRWYSDGVQYQTDSYTYGLPNLW